MLLCSKETLFPGMQFEVHITFTSQNIILPFIMFQPLKHLNSVLVHGPHKNRWQADSWAIVCQILLYKMGIVLLVTLWSYDEE